MEFASPWNKDPITITQGSVTTVYLVLLVEDARGHVIGSSEEHIGVVSGWF